MILLHLKKESLFSVPIKAIDGDHQSFLKQLGTVKPKDSVKKMPVQNVKQIISPAKASVQET